MGRNTDDWKTIAGLVKVRGDRRKVQEIVQGMTILAVMGGLLALAIWLKVKDCELPTWQECVQDTYLHEQQRLKDGKKR